VGQEGQEREYVFICLYACVFVRMNVGESCHPVYVNGKSVLEVVHCNGAEFVAACESRCF